MTRNLQRIKKMEWRKTGVLGLLFFLFTAYAGAQNVKSSVDTSTIKIGEKISYKIIVDADPGKQVVFPKASGASFSPLEVFDSTAVDTFKRAENSTLQKEYALTQFDSGAYTIPKQKVFIGEDTAWTNSYHIKVNDVSTDTTKQKLYPIKSALDIKASFSVGNWIWWVLAAVIIAGLVYVFIRTRKKIIEKKKELPPYEKALESLKKLDENKALETGKVKVYYSALSEAVKRYIDEKIEGHALESTTDEFIALLKTYKAKKQIYLKEQVIDSLELVLKRADLAKFAGINTDKLTAREDRNTVEENINAFNQAIPEPTEEEKLLDEAYRRRQERKQKKRRLFTRLGIAFLGIALITTAFVGFKGMDYVKELVSSHPTQKMLKKDWVKSEYGSLGMTLSTPEVLIRQMDTVGAIFPRKTKSEERFSFGELKRNFYIKLTNIRFKKEAEMDTIDVGGLLDQTMEEKEISNATVKNQDFTTLNGEEGQKLFGTFTYTNPRTNSEKKKAYTFLVFNERGGVQELFISYDQGDKSGKEIENRVTNSVEFNSENDG